MNSPINKRKEVNYPEELRLGIHKTSMQLV
jgi:hypothetical protein